MQHLFFLVFLSLVTSCRNADKTELKTIKRFELNREELLSNMAKWYEYSFFNIQFGKPFIGLDADSNQIDKKTFLNSISVYNFCAFRVAEIGDVPVYKLHPIKQDIANIRPTAKQLADIELACLKMEEAGLPEFDLTDIEGKRYTKANTKGKFLIFKCWFIRCGACVEEFPQLNKLVDSYKNRDNILFVSLASDNKQDLIKFLNKKPFKYAVVPMSGKFMTQKLGVQMYPTHILIDQSGKIIKVTHSLEDLLPYIEATVKKR